MHKEIFIFPFKNQIIVASKPYNCYICSGYKNYAFMKKMTTEEFRAMLPKRLNRLGEWLVAHHEEEPMLVINDMRAVLR